MTSTHVWNVEPTGTFRETYSGRCYKSRRLFQVFSGILSTILKSESRIFFFGIETITQIKHLIFVSFYYCLNISRRVK